MVFTISFPLTSQPRWSGQLITDTAVTRQKLLLHKTKVLLRQTRRQCSENRRQRCWQPEQLLGKPKNPNMEIGLYPPLCRKSNKKKGIRSPLMKLTQYSDEDKSSSIEEARLIPATERSRKIFSEDKIDSYTDTDSQETIHSSSKTSFEDKTDRFSETLPPPPMQALHKPAQRTAASTTP